MTIPINSMVLGKLGVNGDRQTFGIGADGDPSPSLSTAHHHAVCYGINPQGGGMNPFDHELGETQSVCHQGGVMQVRTESVAFLPTNSANAQSIGAEDELSPTLAKGGGESGNKPSVAIGFKYKQGEKSQKPFAENGESQALSSGCHDSAVAIGFKAWQSADGGLGDEREVSPTLSAKQSTLEPTVAQSGVQCLTPSHPQTHRVYSEQGAFPSLCHNGGEAGQNQQAVLASLSQMRYIVRRLTPTEAERLMGLPSGYTIPRGLEVTDALVAEFQRIFDTFGAIMAEYEHTKPPKPKSASQVRAWLEKITDPDTCPDSPRYKACGNGWATNQPRWILTRLLAIGEGIDPFTGETQCA